MYVYTACPPADDDHRSVPVRPPLPTDAACVGRRVLILSALWPAETCNENDGRGWTAHIVSYSTRSGATVRFQDAISARGLPYADQALQLSALSPI